MLAGPPGKPPGKAPGCGPAMGNPGICPPYNPVVAKMCWVQTASAQRVFDSRACFISILNYCFETNCQISLYLVAEEENPEVLVGVEIQLHSMAEGEAVN